MPGAGADVAIPTHAEPRWLAEAIGSVLSQTHRKLTLRIIDNSPGGGAAERIADGFRKDDRRVKHIATGGIPPAENWTTGIQAGDSPYVALLPHDETWEPDWLRCRIEFLEAHPECAYAFGAYSFMDQHGRIVATPEHRFREGVHTPREFVPKLYMNNEIGPGTILIRRSALVAVGPYFDGQYRMGYDWELWMRMAVRYPIGYLAVRDNIGRVHPESGTSLATRWGAMHVVMTRRNDELIAEGMDGWELPARVRRRRLEYAHLKAALDYLDEGDAAAARQHLRTAVQHSGHALVNPRTYLASAGLIGGDALRSAIGRLRVLESRVQVGYHVRELATKLGRRF
jgi:glycosyltransferase involved in cell wall biosynthesis